MKTKHALLIFLLLLISSFASTANAQNMYKWNKINIPNVLSFRIPASMELRDNDGFVKKTLDEFMELVFERQFNPSRIVVQTKGFGEIEYLATMLYGRIIVEFDFDDYSDLSNQFTFLNQVDLDEITNIDREELKAESDRYGIKIKKYQRLC